MRPILQNPFFIIGLISFFAISSPTKLFAQCANFGTPPTSDYDCDGVINRLDLDDDNDGILDANECVGYTTVSLGTTLLGSSTSTLDTTTHTFLNVGNITGFNIAIKPSGNFTTGVTASPAGMTTTALRFLINPQGDSTAFSRYVINFTGPIKPTTALINSPQNLFGRQTPAANEQFTIGVTTLGVGTHSDSAIATCAAISTPASIDITSAADSVQYTALTTGGTRNSCGFTSTFTDNQGITGVTLTFTMPHVNGISADQTQPTELRLTVCNSDLDLDGINSYFDLDSDADNCPDAAEGSGNFTYNNLNTSSLPGGSTNVNKNLGGPVDINGIPISVASGQAIGNSENASISLAGDCPAILAISDIKLAAIDALSGILLNWTATTTNPTANFSVERSTNGKDFEEIQSKIPAIDNANLNNYSFTDKGMLPPQIFYRIALHSGNTEIKYSNIASVTTNLKYENITLAPNPSFADFNIRFSKPGNYAITISDARGTVKSTFRYQIFSSNLYQSISREHLYKGIYFVKVTNEATAESTVLKLVLQ